MAYGPSAASRVLTVPRLKIVIAVLMVLLLPLLVLRRPPWIQHTAPVRPATSGRLSHRSDVASSTSRPTEHSRRPEIRNSTFLYMGIAESNPSPAQLARSCFPKSMAITLTFRTIPTAKVPPGECRFQGIYYPNSTWTTARNKLLSVAFDVERKQGWMFEFFVFVDDDVKLILNGYPPKVFVDGEAQFRKLLLRDRPLRASVTFYGIPLQRNHGLLSCARACFTDAAIDVYHRSGVEIFLPYNPVLDRTSWWMSAYIVNLQTAAVAHKYCSIYRQLAVDSRLTTHSAYPAGATRTQSDHEWKDTRAIVTRQLRKHRIPGYEGGLTDKQLQTKLEVGLYGSEEENCTRQPIGVSYARLVTSGNLNDL